MERFEVLGKTGRGRQGSLAGVEVAARLAATVYAVNSVLWEKLILLLKWLI